MKTERTEPVRSTLRLPHALYEAVKKRAEKEGVCVNQLIIMTLARGILPRRSAKKYDKEGWR